MNLKIREEIFELKVETDDFKCRIEGEFRKINAKFNYMKSRFHLVKDGLIPLAISFSAYSISDMKTSIDSLSKDTSNNKVGAIYLFILTFTPIIYSIGKLLCIYIKAPKNYKFISDTEYKKTIIESIKLDSKHIKNGYRIKSFDTGSNDEKYVISNKVNQMLIQNENQRLKLKSYNKIKVKKIKYKYTLPLLLKEFEPGILNHNIFDKKANFYESKLLRMVSDLYIDSEEVKVQQVGYFDGQCSNELVYKIIKSNTSINYKFEGEILLLDENKNLMSLESSPCANYLGASTTVITNDGYIIIRKQDYRNKSNPDKWAPTGSGSVDYDDLSQLYDFQSVIIQTMEREFREENNYCSKDSDIEMFTHIIGYTRLIERGGKPDFFGISKINKTKCEFEENIESVSNHPKNDFDYEYLPIEKDNIAETIFALYNKKEDISIQLYITAEILKENEGLMKETLDRLH